MRVSKWMASCGLLGALWAGGAAAQVGIEPVEPIGAEEVSREQRPGFRVQANLGGATYGGDLAASSRPGALFGVSASTQAADIESRTIGGEPRLDAEVGYESTTNMVSADVGTGDGAIWRHNVSGLVKGGVTIRRALPYVGAGIGASYVNVTDAAESNGFRNDLMAEIPIAAGLDYSISENVTAGARATYRGLFFDEFADPLTPTSNPGGGLLSANLSLGGRF